MKLLLRRTLVRLVRSAAKENPGRRFASFLLCACLTTSPGAQPAPKILLNDSGYFEKRGFNLFVFSNRYGLFGDEKLSGIEIIHHGVRTATNGDVRLSPTPEQWDSIPVMVKRTVNKSGNSIETSLRYPAYDFDYTVKAQSNGGAITVTVSLEKPLPKGLEGLAGFNLEFLPSAYFHKSYLADGKGGLFPLYPSGPMTVNRQQQTEPLPLARCKTLVLAPEDKERRITVSTNEGRLALYDGRNKAQNGWFVLRSLLPPGRTGAVVTWTINASTVPNWTRLPVIAYSQVGYHPLQQKKAVIELDKAGKPLTTARLLKVMPDGSLVEKTKGRVSTWGYYLRYRYATFDFSAVKEEGVYLIECGNQRTGTFRIAPDVYETAWHPTLDVYFPVAMDHMFVNEAYRVWHGASHLDDALQAPTNHPHFDLYAQGPTTGNRFKPYEHIPGLNMGGWYDAGDFDLRTQTIYGVVSAMVQTWELFGLKRDETTINQQTRYVDMHVPDGKPDLLQQIEHGTLFLLSHYRSVGYALNGIVEAHLSQYTHLGDAVTKTDNLVYNPALDSLQTDGRTSGTFDDRWAFTNKSTALNYGSIAALAAASRALKGYNDTLSAECLATALRVWKEEHSHAPDIFDWGNTTGGPVLDQELKAAVELLITTKDSQYASRITELIPSLEKSFGRYAQAALRALPHMDAGFSQKMEALAKEYRKQLETVYKQNPFGVPVTGGGWAGSGQVVNFALTNYYLHKAFPSVVDAESVFRGLNYLFGCHPGSNISLVSGVGTHSKEVAYGNNRADYSFIAGGVVPGVLLIQPDFPENKEDWPFLWGENEYVVGLGASYILLANAANELLQKQKQDVH